MSPMLIIAKREFRSYFDSPIAYIVICLSFFALGLMFFFLNGGFWQLDRASVSRLFESAPMGLSFLVVPVVTMRLLAEERRSGTLEMLITLPVKDSDVVLGKYLGALGLVLVLVLSTLAYPIVMFKFPWNLGPLDGGPVASGYFGMVLFSCAAVAIGLLISALTESQAVAFFITFFVLGALWLFGDLASKASEYPMLAALLNYVSFQSRLSNFWRGLVDSRDVVFFLSVTALSLMVAFRALERRKWA
ncbi:MAG: ABC transporter permease [Myxococcales bacterium]|jgi:ABC-2 type transport system permease protein